MDLEKKSIVWGESDFWFSQHHPKILENGNILLFDNHGGLGETSRVIEFDPFSREIHWQYGDSKGEHFYSANCGSCQRLPNGNTLITVSEAGIAIEVTPDKKTIVWEYINPHRDLVKNEVIALLFHVTRLKPDFTKAWLQYNNNRKE